MIAMAIRKSSVVLRVGCTGELYQPAEKGAAEAWVHEPGVQYQLGKAAQWLKENPRSETSIDALARKARKRK
jgi:hypothetical protein